MPTRVEFPTAARVRIKRRTRAAGENSRIAVQHLTKSLFLSKLAESLRLIGAIRIKMKEFVHLLEVKNI
jgi:hypothetical protein